MDKPKDKSKKDKPHQNTGVDSGLSGAFSNVDLGIPGLIIGGVVFFFGLISVMISQVRKTDEINDLYKNKTKNPGDS